mmetsp:Transcript_9372/g.13738  ORF Transcript_9372/g.13738 Transcript_9372/m.13738 type:complete len:204 (-) Transcript_9372:118-729(-)
MMQQRCERLSISYPATFKIGGRLQVPSSIAKDIGGRFQVPGKHQIKRIIANWMRPEICVVMHIHMRHNLFLPPRLRKIVLFLQLLDLNHANIKFVPGEIKYQRQLRSFCINRHVVDTKHVSLSKLIRKMNTCDILRRSTIVPLHHYLTTLYLDMIHRTSPSRDSLDDGHAGLVRGTHCRLHDFCVRAILNKAPKDFFLVDFIH